MPPHVGYRRPLLATASCSQPQEFPLNKQFVAASVIVSVLFGAISFGLVFGASAVYNWLKLPGWADMLIIVVLVVASAYMLVMYIVRRNRDFALLMYSLGAISWGVLSVQLHLTGPNLLFSAAVLGIVALIGNLPHGHPAPH